MVFLMMSHTKLDVYKTAKELILECYKQTSTFPNSEKFGLVSQIRPAAVSILLNLAEGAARKSNNERNRFYEIARSSVIEVETAIEISNDLGFMESEGTQKIGNLILREFQMLSRMIKY